MIEEVILQQSFIRNEIDPCAFLKQEGGTFCILCIYVNDEIIVFKVKSPRDYKGFFGLQSRGKFWRIDSWAI